LITKIKNLGVIKKIKNFKDEYKRHKQLKKIKYENEQWDKKLKGLK